MNLQLLHMKKCNPPLLAFQLVKYPKFGQKLSFLQLVKVAYEAVDSTYMMQEFIRQTKDSYAAVWCEGYECLFRRTRIRPVILARSILFHYLMKTRGGCKSIAKRFDIDHTSVLHGRNFINDVIGWKFDAPEKDAYYAFLDLVNKYESECVAA